MESIKENGQAVLDQNTENKKLFLMTIIGEIEGHELLGSNSKSTNSRFLSLFIKNFML